MPRLRYKKNFNFKISDFTEKDEDANEDAGAGDISATGSHFLSNQNILSTLDVSELRLAINYHETQTKLLKEELNGREDGTRPQQSKNWFQNGYAATDFCPEMFDSSFSGQSARKNKRANSTNNGHKLSPEAKARTKAIKIAEQLKALGLTAKDLEKLLNERVYGA